MSSPAGRLHHASAPRTPAFELTASRQFTAWLAEQKARLTFITYQAGKLFLLGLQPDGQLSIFNRTFERCMGLWTSPDRLLMSSLYQLWRFENALAPRQTHQGYDRIYVPQLGWTTGDLDVHDIAVDRVDDALEAVSPLDGGTFDPTSRVITWNLGDLPPGTPRDVSQPKHKAHVLLTAPHIGRAVCSGLAAHKPGGFDAAQPRTKDVYRPQRCSACGPRHGAAGTNRGRHHLHVQDAAR
jgi:hypothetical protein